MRVKLSAAAVNLCHSGVNQCINSYSLLTKRPYCPVPGVDFSEVVARLRIAASVICELTRSMVGAYRAELLPKELEIR